MQHKTREMYRIYILTLLCAIGFIVFHHEVFEKAQQLHRLLVNKEQANTHAQQGKSYP